MKKIFSLLILVTLGFGYSATGAADPTSIQPDGAEDIAQPQGKYDQKKSDVTPATISSQNPTQTRLVETLQSTQPTLEPYICSAHLYSFKKCDAQANALLQPYEDCKALANCEKYFWAHDHDQFKSCKDECMKEVELDLTKYYQMKSDCVCKNLSADCLPYSDKSEPEDIFDWTYKLDQCPKANITNLRIDKPKIDISNQNLLRPIVPTNGQR